MPKGAALPSIRQIIELAEGFGIDMPEADAEEYQTLMRGPIASFKRLEDLPEYRPPVKYPRGPGYRPSAEENPYNAWYWRCQIEGAAEGPLKGYDVGIKDAIGVAGIPMMNGSRLLEGFIADFDATVVTRILDAGGTIVGKTNAEDCSFSGGGHTCALGPTRNPRKPTHSPGGSSSGSGAAVAAGDVKMALGGDQAGSIRIPACRNGIVGLKPTFGLVPYTGAVMIEMTIDTIGPMCDTVENAARLLSVVAGPCPHDPRQRGVIPADWVSDYMPAIDKGVKGLKIGLLDEGFGQSTWPDLGFPGSDEVVDNACLAAVSALEKQGAEVVRVSAPIHMDGPHIWNGVGLEGSCEFMIKGNNQGTNWRGLYNTRLQEALGRGFDSRINDLPVAGKLVLILGEYMKQYYHGRYHAMAQNQRHLLDDAYDDILKTCDVIAMPTIPFVTPPLAEPDSSIVEVMRLALDMINNTCQFSLTGHPAISVPCGAAGDLPIGLMLVGNRFDDLTVLQVADAVEKTGDWRER
jgi:amidase